jgi:UDP-2,4-diacetamido-2,4,6-trideoxy-beta-L-altropyranose hydrolase
LSNKNLFYGEVSILAEGSPSIGFGHIRRSITLAREINDVLPVRLCLDLNGRALDDKIKNLTEDLIVTTENAHDINSDVMILDLSPSSMKKQLSFKLKSSKILCLDLFSQEFLPDITVNLLDHSNQMRNAYASLGRPDDYFEGSKYAVIRSELIAHRPMALHAGEELCKVVITMGGADPSRRTLDALQELCAFRDESWSITVIIGPLFPDDYQREISMIAPAGTQILNTPSNYDLVLASADLVLCSGGGGLLECMCLGKATVVYPQTPAEENHARFHAGSHACVMADSLSDVISSEKLRKQISSRAHQQIDGLGAKRIATLIQRLALGSDLKQ